MPDFFKGGAVMEVGIAIYTSAQLESVENFRNFSLVEISGEMLEDAGKYGLFSRIPDGVLVRELLPRRIVDDLPDASGGVCRELLKLFEQRCILLEKYGIEWATLTPNLGRAKDDVVYREKLLDLMRCMFGIALRHGVNFVYELRLPESFPGAVDEMLKFCRSCNIRVRVLIDFHPHEPRGFEMLEQAVAKLKMKRDAWRISFDVASCNYLSLDVVKRVFALSRPGSYLHEYVVFSPGPGSDMENYRQLDQIAGECRKAQRAAVSGGTFHVG